MYTLGGGIHEDQGWGRADETFAVKEELAAYGVGPEWFGLGDRDFATHIVRTQMIGAGYPLSAVTEALCARWQPGVRLLPMTDDRIETHVLIDDPDVQDAEGRPARKAVHFPEYWVRLRASVPAHAVIPVGAEQAKPAPGVLEAIAGADVIVFPPSNPVVSGGTILAVPGVREAIADADVILFPPSNPVVSIGTILAVPGVREAIADAGVPVIGLSPIVGDAPVRGMADKVLAAVGVESTAAAVARHYGSGLLDGWLVDTVDAATVDEVEAAGIRCRAVPLMMTDIEATARMAAEALKLAEEVRA